MAERAARTAANGWRSLAVPGLCALVALAILVSLGNWQMRRMTWKETRIAAIAARTEMPPISLAEAEALWDRTGEVDYRPVRLSGRFLHSRERHLVATRSGVPGWHVYTPLQTDGGAVVLVNRGFVPADRKASAARADGQIEGMVSLEALARNPPPERPNAFVPDHDEEANVFTWRDISAMGVKGGLGDNSRPVPFFLEARSSADVAGGPRGGVTRVVLDNKHLGYALTWYGIALTLIGVFAAFAWPRIRR